RSTTRFTAKAKSSSSMRLKALARTKSRVQIASLRRIYHTAVQLSPSLSSNANTEYQPSPSLSGLRDRTHLESSPAISQEEQEPTTRPTGPKLETALLSAQTEAAEGRREWTGYTPEKAGFIIKFNDERLLYRINSAFVLPGDEIFLDASDSRKKGDYT